MLRLLFKKDRRIIYSGLKIFIPSGCFCPVATFSTDLLLKILKSLKKDYLFGADIGVGVGSLSLPLVKMGWEIVGTDINKRCLRASWRNSKDNGIDALYHPIVCSSLSCIRDRVFDIIFTNPPFFPLVVKDDIDFNICSGEQLEILNQFLSDIRRCINERESAYICISSLVNHLLEKLFSIYGFKYKIVGKTTTLFDKILVYKLSLT